MAFSFIPPLAPDLKPAVRRQARQRRAHAHADDPGGKAARLAQQALGLLPPGRDQAVAGYVALRDEIDPSPLLTALAARGQPLCLPVVAGRDRPLVFRAWTPGDRLEEGGFGTSVPAAAAPERFPTLVLVPMLAFDRRGYRLGYGGGFYDRTLPRLRARGPVLAVGLAYAEQEVAALPVEAHDAPLDAVVTPDAVIRPGGTPA